MKVPMKIWPWVAFIILVVAAIVALQEGEESNSTLDPTETAFAVTDTANVDKVFIAWKDGRKRLLERVPGTGRWVLDSTVPVTPAAMGLLLEAVRNLDVKRKCTRVESEAIIKELAGKHKKVEVYVKGNLVRSYYIGRTTGDYLGNYGMLLNSQNPYICYLPGFEGYVDIRFDADPVAWRYPAVLGASAQTLRLFQAYDSTGNMILHLRGNGNTIEIENIPTPNAEKLLGFVGGLRAVFVSEFMPQASPAFQDSITAQKPYARFVLNTQDANGELMIYPREGDVNRLYFAHKPSGFFGMIERSQVRKLLAKAPSFAQGAK